MAILAQEHHVEIFNTEYFRSSWPAIALILGVSTALLGSALLLHFWAGIPMGKMTRDPISVARVPAYTGFVSQTGILFWSATAAICIFSAVVLTKTHGDAETKRFMAVAGLLSLVLGLDDAFLLHEKVFPFLGVPELAVYAGYGGLALGFLFRFRSLISGTESVLLGAALTFFAVSIAVDLLLPSGVVGRNMHYLLEDGSKLVGIVSWLAYFFRVGVSIVGINMTRLDTPSNAMPHALHTQA